MRAFPDCFEASTDGFGFAELFQVAVDALRSNKYVRDVLDRLRRNAAR